MSRPFQIALAVFATLVLGLGVALLFGAFDKDTGGSASELLDGDPDTVAGEPGGMLSGDGSGTGTTAGGPRMGGDGTQGGQIRPGQRQPSGPDYTDPETAASLLRKALLDADPQDWRLAQQVLRVFPGPLPEDVRSEILGSLRTSERLEATRAIQQMADGSLAGELLRLLDDPTITPGLHRTVLAALGKYKAADNQEVVRGLEARLSGEFAKDAEMLQHLANRKGPEATRALMDYLLRMDKPTRLGHQMFRNLKAHESEDGAAFVREAFQAATDTDTKLALMRVAAQPGADNLADAVIALDKDGEDDLVRSRALETLAQMGGKRPIEYLLELGRQPGMQGERARNAYGWISSADKEGRALMEEAYAKAGDHPEPDKARAQLLTAFGNLGHTDALPKMRAALEDGSTRVRVAAVDAIGSLGRKAQGQAPAVIAFYGQHKDDQTAAMRAVVTLGNIGGAKALAALEQIANDPNTLRNVKRSALGLSRRMRATQPRPESSGAGLAGSGSDQSEDK